MKIKNNENGSALLMVLLLMLVFTILGMGLLTMNISAAKQFNKEEQVQARHFAEMGVLHYKADVEELVEVNNRILQTIISNHNPNDKNSESLQSKIDNQNNKFCSGIQKSMFNHSVVGIQPQWILSDN